MSDNIPPSASEELPTDWIQINSEDGYAFLIQRHVVHMSAPLKNMLELGFGEAKSDTIELRERAIIVEKLCEYMMFKSQYSAAGIKKEEIPVSEFLERINPELALELLLAADFLEL